MINSKIRRSCFTANLLGVRTIIVASLFALFAFILGSFLSACPTTVYASNPAVWTLVWSDEFNGPSGSAVNAHVEGGSLVIKALKETFTGPDNITRDYTSARLLTSNRFTQAYGRFEARLKIPFGQGLWPAFWMLGDNIGTAGWPTCGEIDIMENIGKEPSTVHGTFHGPGYSGAQGVSAAYALPNSRKFSDDFHTFAVEWEPNVMRFYVDGLLYKTRTPADLPAGKAWVFDHPFFIILNVAVGGDWPGNPDATTVFPQQMLVDYVRVYQRTTPSNVPVLLTDEGSNRALALDSVLFTRDPFKLNNPYNFAGARTRLMLLSANLDLEAGDGPASIVAQADDGNGNTFPLTVEWVGRLPNFDWITMVIARLPDQLANADHALISVAAHNQLSNQVLVSLSP
jgi:beta-glucanase (GH16 family)